MKVLIKALVGTVLSCQLAANAIADVAPLSVSGNKILAGGQQASFAGNSLFWSNTGWEGAKFYNASVVSWLKSDWKSTLVRAAMGVEEGTGNYLQDPVANKNRVKAVVDAAIANDMYVIIDWHSHYANEYQPQAIAFFEEMARTYGNRNHVIYEIFNEPKQVSWSGVVKPYAQAVVNAIRAIDPDNLIVVGTPTWSQDVDVASRDKISGNNIAYTLHFYAATHGQYLRDKAQTALNNNAALFVTEWGSVDAFGNGAVNQAETNAWMSFLKTNQISHANWAINDKAEGASALWPGSSSTGGWPASALTPSGTLSRSIIQGWGGGGGCTTKGVNTTIQAESWCEVREIDGKPAVQTETTTDTGGGLNVGYIDRDDWMTYKVNIPSTGTYKVHYRVASLNGGGVIQLEKAGGNPVYGSVNVPKTSGWQSWTTISHDVSLSAGEQRIAIYALAGGFNVNWLKVESSSAVVATIQGENYSAMSGVQKGPTPPATPYYVGWIDQYDWMSYAGTPVEIPSTGLYTIEYRVASLSGGGSLKFEGAGGWPYYGNISVPSTGGWENWTTIRHTVSINAGTQRFGIVADWGGWNLDWFRIIKAH